MPSAANNRAIHDNQPASGDVGGAGLSADASGVARDEQRRSKRRVFVVNVVDDAHHLT